jgi:hypothetical protein
MENAFSNGVGVLAGTDCAATESLAVLGSLDVEHRCGRFREFCQEIGERQLL